MPSSAHPKLIIEGARFTLKTALARALRAHPALADARPGHGPILVPAEFCSWDVVPWGCGLINFGADAQDAARRAFGAWVTLMEQIPDRAWICDRFHLSAQAVQRRRGRTPDFRDVDARLHALGARVILCTRTAESYAAVRAAHVQLTGGDESLYDDDSAFLKKQDELRALAAASALDALEVDVSGGAERALPQILEWLRPAPR